MSMCLSLIRNESDIDLFAYDHLYIVLLEKNFCFQIWQ